MKPQKSKAVIQLTVHNHPGVMSHICGLFARRAFNLEGIACLPVANGARSRVWLAIEDDRRVEQMIKQLQKLRDVIDVQLHTAEHEVFTKLEDFFKDHPEERPGPPARQDEPSAA
jgi:acetolactate synthase I/III small subunit